MFQAARLELQKGKAVSEPPLICMPWSDSAASDNGNQSASSAIVGIETAVRRGNSYFRKPDFAEVEPGQVG